MKVYAKLLIVLCLAVVFIVSCSQAPNSANSTNSGNKSNSANTPANAQAPSPANQVAGGKELYGQHCAICHKETGEGGKVTVEGKTIDPASLTSDKMKKRSDDKLAGEISDGAVDDGMPAFKDKLKPDEIASIVKHLRALQSQ